MYMLSNSFAWPRSAQTRAVGRPEHPRVGIVVMWCPPSLLIEIGLTDLLKSWGGGAIVPPVLTCSDGPANGQFCQSLLPDD